MRADAILEKLKAEEEVLLKRMENKRLELARLQAKHDEIQKAIAHTTAWADARREKAE